MEDTGLGLNRTYNVVDMLFEELREIFNGFGLLMDNSRMAIDIRHFKWALDKTLSVFMRK